MLQRAHGKSGAVYAENYTDRVVAVCGQSSVLIKVTSGRHQMRFKGLQHSNKAVVPHFRFYLIIIYDKLVEALIRGSGDRSSW